MFDSCLETLGHRGADALDAVRVDQSVNLQLLGEPVDGIAREPVPPFVLRLVVTGIAPRMTVRRSVRDSNK